MAATDAFRIIRNAPNRVTFPLRNTAGGLVSGLTGLTVTQLSKDSADFAAGSASAVEIGTSGVYYLDLDATDSTVTDSVTVLVTQASIVSHVQTVPFEPCLESGLAVGATVSSITLRAGSSAVDDIYNGCHLEIVRGTGRGQARCIVDYSGSTKVATIDARGWAATPDATSVYKIHFPGVRQGADIYPPVNVEQVDANATSAELLAYLYKGGFIPTSVSDASPTTSGWTCAAGLSAVDDFYNDAQILFVTGALAGTPPKRVIDYDGDTLTITCSPFPVAPANGDQFAIIAAVF